MRMDGVYYRGLVEEDTSEHSRIVVEKQKIEIQSKKKKLEKTKFNENQNWKGKKGWNMETRFDSEYQNNSFGNVSL